MTIINPQANDFSDISNAIMPWNVLADNYGSDLATKQLQLEHEAYTEGEKRFIKNMQRQIEHGEFADNAAAKPLLTTLIPTVASAVETLRANKTLKVHVVMQAISAESAATITIKIALSRLAKEENVNLQSIAGHIGSAIEDEQRFGRIRDEEAAHFKKHIKEALNKRVGIVYKKAFMQAVEAKMLDASELTSTWSSWEPDMKIHVGIKLLECLVAAGMVEMVRMNAGNAVADMECITLTEEYVKVLTTRAFSLAGIAPVYQPCVVPPKPWSTVTGGGYWAAGRKPLNLIRVGSRKALERYNDVYMPEVYKAVNTIQDTAWKINKKVLDVANQIVNWKNCPVEDVPALERAPLPEKPEDMDTNEVANKAWRKAASAIYRKEKARQSRRLSMEFTLGQANKFSQFKAIWFPYNMDWRGRVYAIPMFNPQSNDMGKGLLTLAKGKPVGEKGFYWLKVHGANTAGVDKVTFPERIQWVEDHHAVIMECAKNPLDCTFWAEQDSPFCFLAFCFEYAGVINHGLSYVSSLPLAFDGSCSGIQHFSAMLRDEVGGKAVNLLPSSNVQDIYRIVAERVNEALHEAVINGTDDENVEKVDKKTGEVTYRLKLGTKKLAAQWLAYGVTRSVTKRSVMTLAYGSKEFGFRDQVLEDTVQPAIDNGKGTMFIEPNQAAGYMAKCIWEAVSVTVVAAVEAMKWLQGAAKLMAAEVKDKKTGEILKPCLPVHWVTPDGFPVWQEYREMTQRRLDLMFMGQVRIQPTVNMKESKKLNKHKQESGVSPNFVHSQDGSHLRKTIVHSREAYGIESFAVIHDSFGTIPADADNLFKAVRETMVETYEHNDVIADFYEQFADQLHESQLDKMPALPAKGSLDIRKILESDFAFA